jgi:uncharacterized protein YkwD
VEQLEDRRLLVGAILYNPVSGVITLDGTAGADQAVVSTVGSKVNVSLTGPGVRLTREFDAARVGGLVFHGYEGDDQLRSSMAPSVLAFGGAGNDFLQTGDGHDRLFGGGGNDTFQSNGGNDWVYGMTGNDWLLGGPGDDRLYGGAGTNVLTDAAGFNTLDVRGAGPLSGWVTITEERVITTRLSAYERELLGYINLERESNRLRPLQVNLRLVAAAQYHATNMARLNRADHTLPGLGNLTTRLRRYGYRYQAAYENLARGISDPARTLTAWIGSTSHRNNMLNANVTEMGVGIRTNSQGEAYYCLVLAQPR